MTRQQESLRVCHGKRKYKPHRWRWLNRVRKWIHERITEDVFEEIYETVSIDARDITDLLNKSTGDMVRFFRARGGTIYMGPYEFFRFRDELSKKQFGPISIPLPAEKARYGNEIRYLGMTVKMLPWMMGVLLVPKDDSR